MSKRSTLPGVVPGLRRYKSTIERVSAEYLRGASGPAKWKPLTDYLSAVMPDLVIQWGEQLESSQRDTMALIQGMLDEKSVNLVAAKSREESQRQINQEETRKFEQTLAETQTTFEREKRHLTEQAEGRQYALERQLEDANRRTALHEAQKDRTEKQLAQVEASLATLHEKHESHRSQKEEEGRTAQRELTDAQRDWHVEEKALLAAKVRSRQRIRLRTCPCECMLIGVGVSLSISSALVVY